MRMLSKIRLTFCCWSVATAVVVQADDQARPHVVLRGLDPVELVEGREVVGSEAIESTRGRFVYRFANAGHKATFDARPRDYAVQSERCAVMSNAPASGDIFLVHDGKIFLFGSPRCQASFRGDPAKYLQVGSKKKVAILVFEGMELLDFAGPGEVFALADGGRTFDVFTVGASSAPVVSQGFVTITPKYSFADCPRPDILIVPGGATRVPEADQEAIQWIKRTAENAEVSLSVCTGALILAQAGLLDGLEATTHHDSLEKLRQTAPKAKIVEGRRFVDNGKIVTSAGISAGIDAALHLVGRILGPAVAAETTQIMEYRGQTD